MAVRAGAAVVALFAAWVSVEGSSAAHRGALVVVTSTEGHLSPCGCTRPQQGGLPRRASALKWVNKTRGPCIPISIGDLTAGAAGKTRSSSRSLRKRWASCAMQPSRLARGNISAKCNNFW